MANINTYLKIQKCTFSEYQNSLKDANTIYFIIDTLQVFIGEKEYITAHALKSITSIPDEIIINIINEEKDINE